MRAALSRLLNNQLLCNLEKCAFHQHPIYLLGFNISHDGLAMDPQKIQVLTDWPLPASLKQLPNFMGFASSEASARCLPLLLPSQNCPINPDSLRCLKNWTKLSNILSAFSPRFQSFFSLTQRCLLWLRWMPLTWVLQLLSQSRPDSKLYTCCYFVEILRYPTKIRHRWLRIISHWRIGSLEFWGLKNRSWAGQIIKTWFISNQQNNSTTGRPLRLGQDYTQHSSHSVRLDSWYLPWM